MTLKVPLNKVSSTGMRKLSSPSTIGKALEVIGGKAKVKRAMWSRRAQDYEQKINSGELIQIAEVVRDLHRKDEQREQFILKDNYTSMGVRKARANIGPLCSDGVEEKRLKKKQDKVLEGKAAASVFFISCHFQIAYPFITAQQFHWTFPIRN